MQFKHPELIWALLLLLIPIFIHLFQLRRFKKTPFTNVKVLQRIQSESRKSSTLKKWLLLLSRLGLLAGLVIAFAQPFTASQSALREKETVIYLDNSFSTQARDDNATVLENAVQQLIQSIPKDEVFSLFTNDRAFKAVTVDDIQNDLLTLKHTSDQLQLSEISLKSSTFFSKDEATEKNLILVSDFQDRMASPEMDSTGSVRKHFVKLVTGEVVNSSVDSVYVDNSEADTIELTALLTTNSTMESTPVSLYDGEKLIAKTAAIFDTDKKAEVKFTIPANQQIKGKVEITDVGLPYDNQLYFTIDQRNKIKVLAIDSGDNRYLKRIFTDTEFDFSQFAVQNLDYGKLGEQNLIVLSELENIPNSLTTSLKSYMDSGGSLIVLPAENISLESYNSLLINLFGTSITQKVNVERNITKISFSHPLYKNVFQKNVTNFQYPKVSTYFRVKSSLSTALSFQDNDPFLVGANGKYLFTASINGQNSNFKESPLIVPTFYNMGINSLNLPALYQLIGENTTIDVPITLGKDDILKVTAEGFEFIPRQQIQANKVSLTFQGNEIPDGIYGITDDEKIIKNISFNYPRGESLLNYIDLNAINSASVQSSVTSLFDSIQNDNSINALWKWFVILALLFLVVEIVIQKYL